MNLINIFKERPRNQTIQLAIRILVVLLFLDCLLGYVVPLSVLPFLLAILIIANMVFLYINNTKKKFSSIILNLIFLSQAVMLFFPILGYVPAVLIGLPLSFLHLLFFAIAYLKNRVSRE